ncbi:MAG: EI24 domain-containing protein [Proteobacteria bacterium]|nr:EI24 domain-containing protein [Pseudomonadota bacterium]
MVASSQQAWSQFWEGVRGYWRGVRWLIKHPGVFVLLSLPWMFAVLALGMGLRAFWVHGGPWLNQMLIGWFPGGNSEWHLMFLLLVIKVLAWFSAFIICLVVSSAVLGILSSPIYEFISVRVEQEILGRERVDIPWSRYPSLLFGEVVKAVIVTLVPLVMLVIPGVNLFAGLVAAFLLGWDFYDYPLARRGWSIRERWSFVRREFWTVLGFGFWLAIPLLQIILVPMAVAGGTILNVEALKRRDKEIAGFKS